MEKQDLFRKKSSCFIIAIDSSCSSPHPRLPQQLFHICETAPSGHQNEKNTANETVAYVLHVGPPGFEIENIEILRIR